MTVFSLMVNRYWALLGTESVQGPGEPAVGRVVA